MIKMKRISFVIIALVMLSISTIYGEPGSDVKTLKWDKVLLTKSFYHSSGYSDRSIQIIIKLNVEDKAVFCYTNLYDGGSYVKREKVFRGKYYNQFVELLNKITIHKKTSSNQIKIVHNKDNSIMELYLFKNDQYYKFSWKSTLVSDYEFEQDKYREEVVQFCQDLAKITNAEKKPEVQVYQLDWKTISIHKTRFFFGSIRGSERTIIKINRKSKTLTCDYSFKEGKDKRSRNRNTDKKQFKTVFKTKTFNESYYKRLMELISQIEIKDRKKKQESNFSWDAGTSETLNFSEGGSMRYFIYLNNAPIKSEYEITGKTQELIDFINELKEITQNVKDSK